MAEAAPRRKGGGNLVTFLTLGIVLIVLFDPKLRTMLGDAAGFVLEPTIGFGGEYPILTIFLAGTVMVLLTTAIRHFTTDWLATARTQAYMRAYNREMMAARKENNTFKLKKLQDRQPEMLEKQQEMTRRQMKSMPITMIVVIPIFAWLLTFLEELDYWYFTAPWNPHVDMFATNGILPWGGADGTSILQHWILLYTALSFPLGSLVARGMKWFAWRERWQKRHPEVQA